MLGLTPQETAQVLGGDWLGSGDLPPLRGVVTDSRRVQPGDLFVALPGARTDGHRFLGEAQARGAGAALVVPDRGQRPPGLPVILVPDPLQALGQLAAQHRRRLRATVLGISGTVGKTTAKDFLATLLGGPAQGCYAAPASFNSESGLPQAVLATPLDADFLVLEYGINAPGEMARLVDMARPDHAWLTALTEVHLEGMGDFETICREKSILAEAVPEGGRVYLGADCGESVVPWNQRWCARTTLLDDLRDGGGHYLRDQPGDYHIRLPDLGEFRLPLLARHEVELFAGAARIAADCGVKPDQLAARCAQLRRPPGRLSWHRWPRLSVVDDAYNASPAAMVAALDVLCQLPGSGRRVAVLGTMREMGPRTQAVHQALGPELASRPLDLLIGVGRGGAWMAQAAQEAGFSAPIRQVEDAAEAEALLQEELQDGDQILLKASRAVGLDRLLTFLEAWAQPASATLESRPDPQEGAA
ncbi:MAG: UDP-N-acetylmuramoyl-tripeptide--D-alanyl-D-alanine ligase [Planctomycetota bacterium]|nr:MAG: UDP-N-acetylmuramoyl-tripeptide--D-alanyl-D-alanine ligase [Planctomycetota bacterium]